MFNVPMEKVGGESFQIIVAQSCVKLVASHPISYHGDMEVVVVCRRVH